MNNTLFAQISELNEDSLKSTDQKIIKLMEEVGELSAEHLKLCLKKGAKGKTQAEVEQELKHEIADCLILLLSIAADYDMSYLDVVSAMEDKIVKAQKVSLKQENWLTQFDD